MSISSIQLNHQAKPNVAKLRQQPSNLYFGDIDDGLGGSDSYEAKEPQVSELDSGNWFTKIKGYLRQASPKARKVLDTFGADNFGNAFKQLAYNYLRADEGYPKNLAMAEHYMDRSIAYKHYEFKGSLAREFAAMILVQGKELEGFADLAVKYLDQALEVPNQTMQTLIFMLNHKDVVLEDGTSLGDKAHSFINYTKDQAVLTNFKRVELLAEHFPQDEFHIETFLERASDSPASNVEAKKIADIYYEGKHGVSSNKTLALSHYQTYLDNSEKFNKNTMPEVMARVGFMLLDESQKDFASPFTKEKAMLYLKVAADHGVSFDQTALKANQMMTQDLENAFILFDSLPKGTPVIKAEKKAKA